MVPYATELTRHECSALNQSPSDYEMRQLRCRKPWEDLRSRIIESSSPTTIVFVRCELRLVVYLIFNSLFFGGYNAFFPWLTEQDFNEATSSLRSELSAFVHDTASFRTEAEKIIAAHKRNRMTLEQHMTILDLLELPQIMDACVRNGLTEGVRFGSSWNVCLNVYFFSSFFFFSFRPLISRISPTR